ncbi:WAT1-related protein At5g64700 isoform X2 [Cajanus cajan]|uniref:WAT1-related protein At5g64700 isoform X2 n=1 Tax=Cajanus cajan TaxID=3821 RepID=UPI0010FB62DF|nr:WAT1-related protein At5g64700 isoform X2 [Cajanus cajan]
MSELKPYLAMFIIQLMYSGLTLLSKAAFNGGMNTYVFIFYRQLTGTLILVPLALILERKRAVPVPLSFWTFCKIFVFSFFGVSLSLNIQAIALAYTSATLAAAIVNSLPASTFFFAVLLRMEKVNIRTKSGIKKIASVLLCLLGVATLAFYKGPQLRTTHHVLSRYHNHQNPHHQDHFSSGKRWILGSLLLFLSVIIWSFWLTIQGALVTGVAYYLQTWVIEKRGPVFSAMWSPLSFIIATTGSVLILGEPLRLGSVLGGILLVLSLYSVLWPKSKEGMTHQTSLPLQSVKECEEVKT